MNDNRRKMIPAVSERRLTDCSISSDLTQKMKLASYHAKLILGSYRADQANDPEIYLTAIAHLLSRYPADIAARLTDPKDGIAGKYKWLPTVSEVKEEADRLIETERTASKRRKDLAEQWALRDKIEAEEKAESLEHRQKVAQRIIGQLRDKGFQFQPDTKPAENHWRRFSAEELLAKYPPKPR